MNSTWVRVRVSEAVDELGAKASTMFTPTFDRAAAVAPAAGWPVVAGWGAVVATVDPVAVTPDAPELVALLHPQANNVSTTSRPVARVLI
jgi:hypothetical protein